MISIERRALVNLSAMPVLKCGPSLGHAMKTIRTVQALRGIAALCVVFFHYRIDLNNTPEKLGDTLFGSGYFGVDLFFMISGFIMVLSTEGNSVEGAVDFLKKRFFRLVPLAMMLTFAGFLLTDSRFRTLLKSLAFIPLDNRGPPFFGYSIVYPLWTLTYEIIFYLIFAVAIAMSHKYRMIVATAIILVVVGAMQFLLEGFTLDPELSPLATGRFVNSPLISMLANPIFFEFVAGMVVAVIYMKAPKINVIAAGSLLIASVVYFVVNYCFWYFTRHGITNIGHTCFLLLLSIVIYEKCADKIFVPAVLMRLGDWSYSIYLSHCVVLFAVDKYFAIVPNLSKIDGAWRFAMLVTITLVISGLLHRYVEKPFVALGRRKSLTTLRMQSV